MAGTIPTSVMDLVHTAAGLHRVDPEQLFSRCRERAVSHARRMVYAELRDAGWSLSAIGQVFGRSHATVLYSLRATGREEQS